MSSARKIDPPEIGFREARETRSFEVEYVGGLWHLDFHHGSRKILTVYGQWVRPVLLAILDDRSRLLCHAQWYLAAEIGFQVLRETRRLK